ncbi:hypothetical protein PS467_39195 [Streptomyces luomodiensis]|uniref:Uncharacterized protein n=1 Tax=Streptomyces luomodiensis TaxID=3026192 RepID=A0ABY9VBC5_9ACTN|nr:hypothetical protein [Streptomyces sp. SCA4-21]WNF00939.1 hypothetical protein PS467_39195 [Streptomyces sp. SCA4-21]
MGRPTRPPAWCVRALFSGRFPPGSALREAELAERRLDRLVDEMATETVGATETSGAADARRWPGQRSAPNQHPQQPGQPARLAVVRAWAGRPFQKNADGDVENP